MFEDDLNNDADMFDRPPVFRKACDNLRHKLMLVDERHQRIGWVDDSSDTRVYWCHQTQDALGPDGEPVDPDECASCRGCYSRSGVDDVNPPESLQADR